MKVRDGSIDWQDIETTVQIPTQESNSLIEGNENYSVQEAKMQIEDDPPSYNQAVFGRI